MAEQPELPDGSRAVHALPEEASAMVSHATLPVKQKHLLVLQQALQQARSENASLKQQYMTHHAQLSAAVGQMDTCKASLEQTAMQCEQWCTSAGA